MATVRVVADQRQHLVAIWRSYAGVSPTRVLAKAITSVMPPSVLASARHSLSLAFSARQQW